MRIAVTGAAGFTGRYLLPELVRRGHDAFALVGDLTQPDALASAIASGRPHAIVHLAARAFVNVTDFGDFYAVNQVGSFNLLEAVARHAPNARVLLASTGQVYGAHASGLLDETQPVQPANHYALSKAAMEAGSRFWAERMAITIARPFNYTGVGQESRYLIPKIVDHFRRRAPVIELGNIDVERDFGDVRSVVEAYAALLDTDAPVGVYNVCTSRVQSIRGIIDRLEAITGHRIEIRVNSDFVRVGDPPVLGGRNTLLQRVAPHWQSRAIDDTLTWMVGADGVG